MIGDRLTTAVVSPSRRERVRRRRPKRCYPAAAEYQLDHPDVTLIHAEIWPRGMHPFGHAWCELPEGIVFDGADGRFYPLAEYRQHVRPVSEVKYSAAEALADLLASPHWGPWKGGRAPRP